jgi:hypothetical protein
MNPHSPIKRRNQRKAAAQAQGVQIPQGGFWSNQLTLSDEAWQDVQIPQGGVWINQLTVSNKPWQERTRQCEHVIQHNKQWQERTL